MANNHANREREPVPRFGSQADWGRYAAGMLTETLYALVLSAVAFGLAALAIAVLR